MRSAEYQRGYDAGYKQALLDALARQGNRTLGGPDAPKPFIPEPPTIKRLINGF